VRTSRKADFSVLEAMLCRTRFGIAGLLAAVQFVSGGRGLLTPRLSSLVLALRSQARSRSPDLSNRRLARRLERRLIARSIHILDERGAHASISAVAIRGEQESRRDGRVLNHQRRLSVCLVRADTNRGS
jgi:hypothetical protein